MSDFEFFFYFIMIFFDDLEKVCVGGIFDPYFWIFYIFLKSTLSNLRFGFQWIEMVEGSSHALAVTPKFFNSKMYGP